MDAADVRRSRLNRFVDLARVYRGWSRQQLAAHLGRDFGEFLRRTWPIWVLALFAIGAALIATK